LGGWGEAAWHCWWVIPSLTGGHRLAQRGVGHGMCPRHDADGSASLLAVTVASNEQNPVLIIIVVAIAGLTVLVSMVVGMMVWRR